jgi:hypothetical protein
VLSWFSLSFHIRSTISMVRKTVERYLKPEVSFGRILNTAMQPSGGAAKIADLKNTAVQIIVTYLNF